MIAAATQATNATTQVISLSNWQAELELGFSRRNDKSVLSTRRHVGPLQVQRPFYPEGPDTCHVYILHPPGGIAGGDELSIKVDCETDAHAVITTPAAGKFYRSQSQPATLTQVLRLENNASLEWLPQETILFDGARAKMTTRIDLGEQSRFIGWEILCLGRPAGNFLFEHGDCRQAFELWNGDKPLFIERSHIKAGSPMLNKPWGLNGNTVTATLVATHGNREILDGLRTITSDAGLTSTTLIDKILVCRYSGNSAESARQYFIRLWGIIRPGVLGIPACAPRIWNT